MKRAKTLGRKIFSPRRTRNPLRAFTPRNLSIRRLFTFGYLADEARRLRGTRYNPASLGPNDKDMIEYFQWVASLPQTAPTTINPEAKEDYDEETDRSFDVPVSCGSTSVIATAAAEG